MSATDAMEALKHAFADTMIRIEKKLDQLLAQTAPRPPSDDMPIHRDPSEKYWPGESYKGLRMSECPPNYLRALAKYKAACAWAARKNDANDPKKMEYATKDEHTAKVALEWADYREALGYQPAPTVTPDPPSGEPFPAGADSDIPF